MILDALVRHIRDGRMLKPLFDRLDQSVVRERMLVLIVFSMVIFVLWYFLIFSPVNNRQRELGMRIQQEETLLLNKKAEYARTLSKQKVVSINKKQENLDQYIKNVTSQVVPVDQMADLLKEMLVKNNGLKLLSLKELTAKRIIDPQGEKIAENYSLWNHGMQLVFEGNYFNTIRYLQRLEKMKWKLFWDRFTYEVTDYPNAKIFLVTHTLVHPNNQSTNTRSEVNQK